MNKKRDQPTFPAGRITIKRNQWLPITQETSSIQDIEKLAAGKSTNPVVPK